ncbi:Nucleoporin Nup120/160 [Penicillium alfredii]|uniref:Nucleoporin Nup120/160 n=1 Tax=Penicillium alfredii TaxID=1506179 RepID=A0A9W9F1J8_9EURO|nr:Nucleoporin Nup120/160 [Penicillium alfredii]KAJ5091866.1 Nucleoporin Nup120/160 [Penicillium alfredii]
MAKIYKDTRVDLRPYSPTTVANIQIPTHESAPRRPRFSVSSQPDHEAPIAKDEDEFARRYLATQGEVYFRKRRVYPRTFLWRVVNDNKVLEIQCADLTKSVTEHFEYNVTLRLDFQEQIIPFGVALADLEDHEVLSVFVITASKQLHTLSLRPEFFRRTSSIDENVAEWCKASLPAPLAFSHPHRLHASSPLELFISLDNGALLRLTRRAGDDGSHWSPLTFDERTWGSSIRGLVNWNAPSSIKHNGRNLDLHVANTIATTSDETYVFAICLNHTLKIWNLATNKLAATRDLLGRPIQDPDAIPYTLNPGETSFLRVFNAERAMDGGHRFYVVTFSPFEDGRFKFWAVKGGLTSDLVIEDLYADAVFRPEDPDVTGSMFWSIADFEVKTMEEGKGMEMWVLWRNHGLYQLYTLHFDLQTLVTDWSTNWVSTTFETHRQEPLPVPVLNGVVDPTEKWLEYLLQPNRYLPEVLETALAIYQEALKPLSSSAAGVLKRSVPLPERLCSTVSAAVSLRKFTEDDMDYTRYRVDTDAKWRQFWQVADDLNKRRFEPVSLAYDAYFEMPWLVLSDACAVVRECSTAELLLHNSGSELHEEVPKVVDRWRHRNLGSELGRLYEPASALMKVASDFRKRFSPELDAACHAALNAEIFSEPSSSIMDRMDSFRERCDFADQISNKTFDNLVSALNEYLDADNLSGDVFYAVIDTAPLGFHGKDSELHSTYFGARVAVSGAQETILLTRQILFDLLILVTFVDGEIEQRGTSTFDAADLFSTLVDLLREYEMMAWLSSNVRKCADHPASAGADSTPVFSLEDNNSKGKFQRTATILEDLFVADIKPRQTVGFPQSYTLTLGIRDVLAWVTRQGEVAYPNALAYIQCDLIAKNNIDLAWDFLRFQANTSWATYVKGRLHVAMSEFDTAAIYFRKAAYLLSCGKPLGNLHEMSSTLLDLVSVNCFHNGIPKYYQHILSIFEQVRSFSHVADFASLALQALDSETWAEQDPEYTVMRTDLLSRLFHASLKTCQFDQAYSALSRYQDFALQKSALGSLVSNMLTVSGPGTAGLKQILRFPISLVPNIASHIDETLVSLARKQNSFGSWLDADNNSADTSPDYHRILQAYRIARSDYRGAAEIAYRNVQRLRQARDAPSSALIRKGRKEADDGARPPVEEDDAESKEIRHELLSLINLLASVDKSEAYILVETGPSPSLGAGAATSPERTRDTHADEDGNVTMEDTEMGSPTPFASRRRSSSSAASFASASRRGSKSSAGGRVEVPQRRVIVTLEHLRREYQSELDRVSRIERGDWEFGIFDDNDEDVDNDDTMVLS